MTMLNSELIDFEETNYEHLFDPEVNDRLTFEQKLDLDLEYFSLLSDYDGKDPEKFERYYAYRI